MLHDYARPLVVKYGGNAMGSATDAKDDPLLREVAALHRAGDKVVLVHGGGPEIDAALARRGITTVRVDGQRVTDAATLAVTEAVLCGTINKRIVGALQALGVNAAGISAHDSGTLIARRLCGRNGEDLGYVGEITRVETQTIDALLEANVLPVIAPLAIEETGANALNVNADASAGAIAAALHARVLILATNVPRVLRDPDDSSSGIDRLTPDEAAAFAKSEACRASMKPKLMAAARAAYQNVDCYIGDVSETNSIQLVLEGRATIVATAVTGIF